MSATSGIGVSDELEKAFAAVVDDASVRFLKVQIENESLVPGEPIKAEGKTLEEDLPKLQNLLKDNEPAYILAHLDGSDAGWLAISYVPDTANVRSKMLYASTRTALTRSLGSAHFPDTLFATSKSDLTPDAYTAHRAHIAAPQPLSARERELAEAREAERRAEGYQASRAPQNLHGAAPGMQWSEEAKAAVAALGKGGEDQLLVLAIDQSETLKLESSKACKVDDVASNISSSEPSYAIFAWTPNASLPKRYIIFIYTCPLSSSVKSRMLYSSGAGTTHFATKSFLASAPLPSQSVASPLSVHRVETSDPAELDEAFFAARVGLEGPGAAAAAAGGEVPSDLAAAAGGASAKVGGSSEARFARPKGPARKW